MHYLFLAFIVIGVANWHYSSGSISLTQYETHKFLARFAVDQDVYFDVKTRIKLRTPANIPFSADIKISLMNDMEWDTALESEDWTIRTSLARFTNLISLPFDGTWSRWEASKILIKNRPQVWYVLISDCLFQSHEQFPDLGYIDYEIEMKNDGSHFSHEHYGQLPITFIALATFAYFLLTTAFKFFREINSEDLLETPLLILIFAVYFEFLHLSFTFTHLFIYWFNGSGLWIFLYIATIMEIMSQVSIVALVLLISFGWTITFKSLNDHENYLFLIGGTFITHLAIAALTLIDNGRHHKYHDYEGFQGLLLVIIRLGIFWLFIYKVKQLLNIAARKNVLFIKEFLISTSVYMLAFPVLWFISYYLNPHRRLKFIVYGNLLIQMIAVKILIDQLSKKGSKYYEASLRSQGILPTKLN